jgi:pimeloyl-ACP methyl ester carboxylesterase
VRSGTGPLILLLHDLGGSRTSFDGVASRLLESHQVCAVDLLGHGSSGADATDLSVRAQAEALVEVMTELRVEGACLVGHSLGGSVAMRVAARVPERVDRLVLLAAGSYESPVSLFRDILRWAPVWNTVGLLGRTVRRRIEKQLLGRPAGTAVDWRSLGRAYRQTMGQAVLSEMEEIVDDLVHPMLVLWGEDDRVIPVDPARVLFQEKKNVRFVEIAGGSHFIHEEQPAAVAEMVLDFLS